MGNTSKWPRYADSNPATLFGVLEVEPPRNFAAPSTPALGAAFGTPRPERPRAPANPDPGQIDCSLSRIDRLQA